MFHSITARITGALLLVALFIFAGCDDNEGVDTSVVDEIVQDFTDSMVEEVVDAEFATATAEIELIAEKDITVDNFIDMVVVDSTIYAVIDGGLLVYDLINDKYEAIGAGEKLSAIARHDGEIYVGGTNLFKVVDAGLGKINIGPNMLAPLNPALESIPLQFEDGITSLESFDGALIIGTNRGLFSKSDEAFQSLRDDIVVTALTSDEDGLWVGTDGGGLFRMQDDKFHKRFLLRDTSIFDNVHCLDYSRGYVYVGTSDAFYIFDGGQWETLTTENGLPSNYITDINADGWVIYVGTDEGVISYFNGDFMPVKNLDSMPVNAFGRWDSKMIVGTNDALMMKSRAGLKILVESDLIDARVPAFVDEVIDEAAPDINELVDIEEPEIIEITDETVTGEPENEDPIAAMVEETEQLVNNEAPAIPDASSDNAVIENDAVGFEEETEDGGTLTQKPTGP